MAGKMKHCTRCVGRPSEYEDLLAELSHSQDRSVRSLFHQVRDGECSFLRDRVVEHVKQRLEEDPEYRKLVVQIMEEENRDRKIMYDRVMQVNTTAGEATPQEVYAVFAKLNRENTAQGCWIQLNDGSWIKKEKK